MDLLSTTHNPPAFALLMSAPFKKGAERRAAASGGIGGG